MLFYSKYPIFIAMCTVDRKVMPFCIKARSNTPLKQNVLCVCKNTHPGTRSTLVILKLCSETDGESEDISPSLRISILVITPGRTLPFI